MPPTSSIRLAANWEDIRPLTGFAAFVAAVLLLLVTPASAGLDVEVSINGLQDGSTVAGTVQWEATTKGNVERVEFSTDNGPVRWIEKDAPYRWLSHGAFDTKTMPDGVHVFTVVAYSSKGEARKDVSLRVSNAAPPPTGGTSQPPPTGGTSQPPPTGSTSQPPPTGGTSQPPPTAAGVTVSVPGIQNGGTVAGTIQWSAATTGQVDRVEFSTDGGPTRWIERDAPYSWLGNGAFDTKTMPDGTHVFTVVAYSATSQARQDVTLRVANTAPLLVGPTTPTTTQLSVTTTAPLANSTVSGVVPWTAQAIGDVSAVEFRVDGVLKQTVLRTPYTFQSGAGIDTRTLSDGGHTLSVTASGTGGSKTHSVAVTVANASTALAGAPKLTAAPMLTGTPRVGAELSLSQGTWQSATPMTYLYGWERCTTTCSPIAGATGARRVVDAADVGYRLRGVVRATNGAGTSVASTAMTAGVTPSTQTTQPLGSALPSRLPMSSGNGGTWYVDGTRGSDSNPGSSAAPWRTITKALATVPVSGSIIRVRPGTYASSGTSYAIKFERQGDVSDPVTVMAETPGTAVITNANQSAWTLGAWIYNASGLRLQDLTFRITTAPGANVGADAVLIENSDRIELFRCTVNETATSGVLIRGGKSDGQSADNVWLLSNTFRPSGGNAYAQTTGIGWTSDQYYGSKGSHNVYAGQTGDASAQSTTSGTTRFVAANNVFVGSTAGRSIELGPQARGSLVVNNTFFGNHIGDVAGWSTNARLAGTGIEFFANSGGASYATSNNVVKNNLFVDLNGHGSYGSGPSLSGNLVANNMAYDLDNGRGNQGDVNDDFEETWGSSLLFAEGTGNLQQNPMLVAPQSYDLRLQAASPAVGRADPAYALGYDGNGQARDGAPDLGALEQ